MAHSSAQSRQISAQSSQISEVKALSRSMNLTASLQNSAQSVSNPIQRFIIAAFPSLLQASAQASHAVMTFLHASIQDWYFSIAMRISRKVNGSLKLPFYRPER
ncbi:MAG TPA: hypothetical protein VK949_06545 [Methylotenera sp.]|nr:hypothetical protein [Methylotenera sp.]